MPWVRATHPSRHTRAVTVWGALGVSSVSSMSPVAASNVFLLWMNWGKSLLSVLGFFFWCVGSFRTEFSFFYLRSEMVSVCLPHCIPPSLKEQREESVTQRLENISKRAP